METTLSTCPFCGSEATIDRLLKSHGGNLTGNIPEGAELIEVRIRATARRKDKRNKFYRWEKYGYMPHCCNKECLCRKTATLFNTEKEALEAWNKHC